MSRAPVLQAIPNALTVLRIALAGAFPFVPAPWRIAVLAGALLTEYLDGALARHFGWTSRFGRVLDPIADRCLFVAVVATLLIDGSVTVLELAALGARDLLMVLVVPWLLVFGHASVLAKMRPRLAGKLTTVLQYVALFWVLVDAQVPRALLAVTLIAGVIAAAQYLLDFRRLRAA